MDTLQTLLPKLKTFNAILVTGPQRSGTTIAARVLAQELGLTYHDEEEIGIYDWHKAFRILQQGDAVLQAPGLMYLAHWFNRPNMAIVIVRRDLYAIYASETRIGWRTAYGGLNVRAEIDKYHAMYGMLPQNGDIAALKYSVWDNVQKDLCDNAFDLDYESLREHSLWKDERKNFTPRQYA